MLYFEALGWGSRSQNPVYRPANLRAIFHIKSDRAMFDNIAVLSGNGSSDRVLAAGVIGLFSLVWHTTKCSAPFVNSAQEICQALIVLKTPWIFFRSKRPVNFFDVSSEGAGDSPRRSRYLAKSAEWRAAEEPPVSTNL
jgi:hypothetical protein